MTTTQKLHAWLAHSGVASRRKAEAMILAGQVMVNGQKAHVGQRVTGQETILVRGKQITVMAKPLYILINKPRGVISSTNDELHRQDVTKLVPIKERLYPVGRLDQDSEGLMLLTNDGDLAYRLTHPKFGVPKTYQVLVDRRPTSTALDFIRRGVKLNDGPTQPAQVTLLNSTEEGTWLEVVISEGRKHQVRRMLERAGYDTKQLIRTQLGPFTLADLSGKKYRELSAKEVTSLL